ncbi:hypothetical protein ACFPRL_02455 [Pseudoclavibacter helvolus]
MSWSRWRPRSQRGPSRIPSSWFAQRFGDAAAPSATCRSSRSPPATAPAGSCTGVAPPRPRDARPRSSERMLLSPPSTTRASPS